MSDRSQKEICFIGEKDIIAPFAIFNADVYYFGVEQWPAIKEQVKNKKYQIVFITEEVAPYLKTLALNNVVVLPNSQALFFGAGKTSLGVEELRQVIIKAVGTDILVE